MTKTLTIKQLSGNVALNGEDIVFSTDNTLADNSDTFLPSQKAIKSYVDTRGVGTQTAVAGAATLNKLAGIITSESLSTATTYTLTLTNSFIASTSVVLVTTWNSAAADTFVKSVTAGSGSVTIVLGFASLTGTVVIAFAVHN